MKIKDYWEKNHKNRLIDEAKHNFLRIDFDTFLVPVELVCAVENFFVFSELPIELFSRDLS
jgi:hypothetical protein